MFIWPLFSIGRKKVIYFSVQFLIYYLKNKLEISCKRIKKNLCEIMDFLVYKETWWFTSNCFLHVFRNGLPLSILNCQIKIKYFFIAISQEKNCKKRKTTIQSITLVHYLEAGASKMFRSTTRATLKSVQDMNIRLGKY